MLLNPSSCWNRATQIATWTHGLLIEITHLVLGLNEAQVLDVSSQKEFSERKIDRWEVALFRVKHTLQTEYGSFQKARDLGRTHSTEGMWAILEGESPKIWYG